MFDLLHLQNWSVVNVERGDTCVIHAQFTIRPECCVKCGSTYSGFDSLFISNLLTINFVISNK